jgi:hypothetical protein
LDQISRFASGNALRVAYMKSDADGAAPPTRIASAAADGQ